MSPITTINSDDQQWSKRFLTLIPYKQKTKKKKKKMYTTSNILVAVIW